MFALVAAAAASAAVVAVGAAVLQSSPASREGAATTTKAGPLAGAPPLLLDLGVRTDPEATALRRAARLYERGRRRQALEMFARHASLEARVAAAVARWPRGTIPALRRLAATRPGSALVRLHLGLALFWSGRRDAAVHSWRAARRVEPDSLSAVRADDLLHPNFPRGRPIFVPSFAPPPQIASLPPARQLASLARGARTGGTREKLLYGVALQRLGRPLSARRQYAAAADAAPADIEARVADAVGRFEKSRPQAAFSRLGPLAARHPRSPTVRFHLGLLLLWLGELEGARRQLAACRAVAPRGVLGREAARFLRELREIRPS